MWYMLQGTYTTYHSKMKKVLNMQALSKFKQYLMEEEKSHKTIEKYSRDITKFFDFIGTDRNITKTDIIIFKQKMVETYNASSVNSILVALNSYFVFWGMGTLKVKLLKIQRKSVSDDVKELTKAEYQRLLASAKKRHNERLLMLMQTICNTGIRVSEHKYITVEAVHEGRAMIHNKGKVRMIIIPKKLRSSLLKYCKLQHIEKGTIFITKKGNAINRSNIWTMMKHLCEDAQVEKSKVFPHNLRHLFALTYYRLEKDVVRLADLLGHSSIDTTRIYTKTSTHEFEKQLFKMNLMMMPT